MICGLRESVFCVCSNSSVLGQQYLLRKIYRFRSLLVYLESHDLSTACIVKEKGFSTPQTWTRHITMMSNTDYSYLLVYLGSIFIMNSAKWVYAATLEAKIILSWNMKFTVAMWLNHSLWYTLEQRNLFKNPVKYHVTALFLNDRVCGCSTKWTSLSTPAHHTRKSMMRWSKH